MFVISVCIPNVCILSHTKSFCIFKRKFFKFRMGCTFTPIRYFSIFNYFLSSTSKRVYFLLKEFITFPQILCVVKATVLVEWLALRTLRRVTGLTPIHTSIHILYNNIRQSEATYNKL